MCHSFLTCNRQELELALREISRGSDVAIPDAVGIGVTAYPGTLAPVIMAQHAGALRSVTPREGASQGHEGAHQGYEPASQGRECESQEARQLQLDVEVLGFGWPVEWKDGTVFNARFESLLSNDGMWAGALESCRCIVPCSSFFESHMSEMSTSLRTGKLVKRRYAFSSPDGGPLLLGAVCDGGHFSIVTTSPNADVAPVHDRMPLVLSPEEARIWLDLETPIPLIAKLQDRSSIRLHALPEGTLAGPIAVQEQLPLI